jgi:hypothetical protein
MLPCRERSLPMCAVVLCSTAAQMHCGCSLHCATAAALLLAATDSPTATLAGGDFGQVDAAVNQHPASPAGAENGEELEGPPHAEGQRSVGDPQAGPSGQRPASKSGVTSPARPAAGTSSSNGRRSRRDSKRQRLSYESGYKEPAPDCSMSTS